MFFELLGGPLDTVAKKTFLFPKRGGGCPICPFLFPVLERASRGRWRESEEMCWLLGAASLNSFMSAGKRAALDSRSLHGRNGATHCPTLLMQPVDFSLAPLLLAPLFFLKVFNFGCKQSPRKASASQENSWHYLICRQASISAP